MGRRGGGRNDGARRTPLRLAAAGLLAGTTLLAACGSGSGAASGQTAGAEASDTTAPEPAPRAPADLRDVTFTTVGEFRLGMTEDEAREAYPDLQVQELAGGCSQWFTAREDPLDAAYALVTRKSDGRILGIIAPTTDSTTDRGVGTGSSFSDVRAVCADHEIEETESTTGHMMLVRGDDSWLSFGALDAAGPIESVRIGDHAYASGWELCSGY